MGAESKARLMHDVPLRSALSAQEASTCLWRPRSSCASETCLTQQVRVAVPEKGPPAAILPSRLHLPASLRSLLDHEVSSIKASIYANRVQASCAKRVTNRWVQRGPPAPLSVENHPGASHGSLSGRVAPRNRDQEKAGLEDGLRDLFDRRKGGLRGCSARGKAQPVDGGMKFVA